QVQLSPPTGSALSGGLRGAPVDLLRGEVLLVGGDAPADAERIDHAAEPVAPEHVAARRSPATRAMRRGRWYSPAGHERRCGGAGLSEMQQAILNEELARARAPQVVNAMAIWWVGPAIIRYGTDAQKKRFIPPILTADEIWATGYSEPTSGSDMAAARTRALR